MLFLCLCASTDALPHASCGAAFVAVDTVAYLAIYPAALALAHECCGCIVNAKEIPRISPGCSSSAVAVWRLKVALLAVLLGANVLVWPAFTTEFLLGPDPHPVVSKWLGRVERLALIAALVTFSIREGST